jgi:hypothetical protein
MEFYIGQRFEGTYPPEAAVWCNENNAHIEEANGVYTIVENAKEVITKAELTAFVSAEADKVAYGGITVVAEGERYLFATTAENISRCGAMLPVYQTMADTDNVLWEVSKDGLIYMLPVSKVQFLNGYQFGVQMTVQVQTIKGTICAEIRNLNDEQLANDEYITAFKENAVMQLNAVNTVFELVTEATEEA